METKLKKSVKLEEKQANHNAWSNALDFCMLFLCVSACLFGFLFIFFKLNTCLIDGDHWWNNTLLLLNALDGLDACFYFAGLLRNNPSKGEQTLEVLVLCTRREKSGQGGVSNSIGQDRVPSSLTNRA